MNDARPFDTLEASKGKKVIIKLKNGEEIIGTLIAGDIHMNIWLRDAEIVNEKKKVSSILVRGDNIVYIVTEWQKEPRLSEKKQEKIYTLDAEDVGIVLFI